MRGGDHHAEVGLERTCQVRDTRSGQHTEPEHVDARGGQAGHDRGLEELPGDAGVAPDNGERPVPFEGTGLAEHVCSGYRQVERELGREVDVRQTPDAVGPEDAVATQ